METLVIDASVAIKWVVEENDTLAALALRGKYRLVAPDLFVADVANILGKKTERGNLTRDEAMIAGRLIQRSGVELLPMQNLMEEATSLAIELRHPAYDCIYLALSRQRGWQFVTADERLFRVIAQRGLGNADGVLYFFGLRDQPLTSAIRSTYTCICRPIRLSGCPTEEHAVAAARALRTTGRA